MPKIKFTSIEQIGGEVVAGLSSEAAPGKLKKKYFLFTNALGQSGYASKAYFSSPTQVKAAPPADFDTSSGFTIAYAPPSKNQRKGVIQTTKGKDAAPISYQFKADSDDQAETPTDPISNAWTYNGHTYLLVKQAQNWNQADADARGRAGYLAEIDSISENSDLYTQLSRRLTAPERDQTRSTLAGGGASYVWLGGSDAITEGDWRWANSGGAVTMDSPPWGSGALGREPDDVGDQDGLAIGLENWPVSLPAGEGFGRAGQWNDQNLREQFFYVVEWSTLLPLESLALID